jgi:hypothetical protein
MPVHVGWPYSSGANRPEASVQRPLDLIGSSYAANKHLIADSAFERMKSTTQACTDSMLTSIIWAPHLGQAARSIATNGMSDDRH